MLHHPRQPLAIPIKSRLHQFDQIAQAVNAFLHRRQCVLLSPVLMYYLSVVPEKRHIIGRHLQPEDASGFVVKFHRGRSQTVLEPQTSMTSAKVAVKRRLMALRHALAQKTSHIFNLNHQHGLARQFLKQPVQSSRILKHQVLGIFDLRQAPVISIGKLCGGRTTQSSQLIQLGMQRTRLQPVRQLLGSLPVLAANQGIIYQLITNPSLIQLAGQPVVTIEIHLQAQWQPSGHSHMDQAQLLVHPIQIVMQTRPPASDHLRVAVGPRVTRIRHRGALLDCKDMDQSGSSASLLENRRNPVLLPKVLSRHHFDIDLMAARQTDDVVSNLPGDRLSETRQVSRAKSRLIHGNQQCAWVRNIHQCALDNDPIKTTQLTGTFLGVAAFQVGAQSRFQRGSSRSGSSHERLLYSSLWFWLCQFRNSDLYTPRTLKLDLTRRGRLPFDECLDLALALTTALEHLHQNGLMHRDIKPANIIFVNGQPKLADIGLVVGIDATKSFVGTEGYIPPEGPTTPQADIYS